MSHIRPSVGWSIDARHPIALRDHRSRPEHEVHALALPPVDEDAHASPAEVDGLVHQEVALELGADQTLVRRLVHIDDDIDVAGHARLRVCGEGP
jgi:hypothetical protein